MSLYASGSLLQPCNYKSQLTRACSPCGITYSPDGYELTSTLGKPAGVKYPYPAEFNHPEWFVSTRESVFSLRLLRQQQGLLGMCQVGFEAFTSLHAWEATPASVSSARGPARVAVLVRLLAWLCCLVSQVFGGVCA